MTYGRAPSLKLSLKDCINPYFKSKLDQAFDELSASLSLLQAASYSSPAALGRQAGAELSI
jgi:hypothetical protein